MNQIPNKYITASYKLYNVTDGKNELIEETTDDRPFSFISGLGMLLEDFENQLVGLSTGDNFNFTLTPRQAYGEYVAERVVDLDKSLFEIDGKFDHEHVFVDAIIPLQNADGNRFNGRVKEIGDEKVKVDLNHPLAGMTLNFQGSVVESREATNEELSRFVQLMSGQGGCNGDCEHCHGEEANDDCFEDEHGNCCGGGKNGCGHHGDDHHGTEHHCCGGHGKGHCHNKK